MKEMDDERDNTADADDSVDTVEEERANVRESKMKESGNDETSSTPPGSTKGQGAKKGAPIIKGSGGKRKRMSKKMKGFLVVTGIIIVALIIGLWGAVPPNYLTVGDVVKSPSAYAGKTIDIKGTVGEWNTTTRTFNLTDGTSNITVSYSALPEGFNSGKDVVVKGTLRDSEGLVIESKDIQVGCPSKY